MPFGGVFRIGEPVLRPFRETIRAAAPDATVISPRFEPVIGAVLLALHEIGTAIDGQIIAVLEESATHCPAACSLHSNTV